MTDKYNIIKNIKFCDYSKYKDIYKPLSKPSVFDSEINFITEYGLEFTHDEINNLSEQLDRITSLYKLNKYINKIELSIKIEAGIFEYTLLYPYIKSIDELLLSAIYNDSLNDIIQLFRQDSSIYNCKIVDDILNKNINPQQLAFMSANELNPEKWEIFKTKRDRIEEKKHNMSTTDIYKCYKCGHNKCQITEKQTRSGDESMTTFITCKNCGNVWKH